MISEIRKEAKSYAFRNDGYGYDLNTCEDIFSDGAEWMQELIIQKACEWLKSVMLYDDIYGVGNNIENLKELINDFRKAMEGGE